jgi:peroxiredoxin
MSKITFILCLGMSIVLAGCATQPSSGIVGWRNEFGIGSYAPDIAMMTEKGETTLNEKREPVLILAFVPVPEDNLSFIRPELVDLAEEFKVLPVTVAQVSLLSHRPQERHNAFKSKHESVSVLFDDKQVGWNAYRQPAPYTVFLIDGKGKIWSIANIENLKSLVETAEHLAGAADYSG